jgi:predicted nucleic acid-binding protein
MIEGGMTVRITEGELARDIHAVLAKVQEGVEVIVEQDYRPVAVMKRREYLDTVFAAIPVEPFTKEMARAAAKIDADAKQNGRVIPFPDLLTGATALHFGYAVGTRNLRHFQMIPGLNVISR